MAFGFSGHSFLAAALAAGLAFAPVARADDLVVTFTEKAGDGISPGGTASFTLNGDGSIAASATSFGGTLFIFGFNAANRHHVVSRDISIPANDSSISTAFGLFNSGWAGTNTQVTDPRTVTWTIGEAGAFASVADAFAPNDKGYEFFAFTLDGLVPGMITQWGWSSGTAPVPEPGLHALMIAGLAVLGLASKPRARARRR